MGKKAIIACVVVAVLMLGAAGGAIWYVLIRPAQQAEKVEAVADAPAPVVDPSGTIVEPDADDGGQDVTGAPGTDLDIASTDDEPDIKVDTAIYGFPEDDEDTVDFPFGYDEDEASDASDDGAEPVSGVGNQTDGYEAGTSGGVGAPDVETVDRDDGQSVVAGAQAHPDVDMSGVTDPQLDVEDAQLIPMVHGVPASFVKAVYSRDKTKCLVRVALPDGKAVVDPAKYMVIAKADDNGHTPSKAVIYSCPSQNCLVIYMNSVYTFGEHAAFAVVPVGQSGKCTVPEDCYVELPYGATYQGSSILDGSKADFTDMMRLMFDDEAIVTEWVSGRSSHVLGSIGDLVDRLPGSSQLQLDTASAAPGNGQSGTGTSVTTQDPSGQPADTGTIGVTETESGQLVGPDGGTSAASGD